METKPETKQAVRFPFEAIASERQFFLTCCAMANRRIGDIASLFRDESKIVYASAKNLQHSILRLHDLIDAYYTEHPQANYDDSEGSNGKSADLTRIYTFCLSLESFADYYKGICPEVTQHCYLAMASLIDAANAIAEFRGREGEPEGMNTLGAYLGFAAFLSDPERLREIAAGIAQNVLEKK